MEFKSGGRGDTILGERDSRCNAAWKIVEEGCIALTDSRERGGRHVAGREGGARYTKRARLIPSG